MQELPPDKEMACLTHLEMACMPICVWHLQMCIVCSPAKYIQGEVCCALSTKAEYFIDNFTKNRFTHILMASGLHI